MFYESLCVSPERELRRLFAFLGRDFGEGVYRGVGRPSSLSRRESAVVLGERPADSWTRSVGDAERERAVEIMALFGLDRIYGEGAMPDPGGLHELMEVRG